MQSLFALVLPIQTFAALSSSDDFSDIEQDLQKAKLARESGDMAVAMETLSHALEKAEKLNNEENVLRILIQIAILRHMINDYDIALDLLFRAEEISENLNDSQALAEVYNHIGAIYHKQRDFTKATNYYNSSIDIYLHLNKLAEIGRSYNNFGVLWQDLNDPLTAIEYHLKSYAIWQELEEISWLGVTNMHLGVCHKLMGNLDSAIYYLLQSIDATKEEKENRSLSLFYAELGKTYIDADQYRQALEWCQKGLDLSTKMEIINFQLKNCQCLYKAHEKLGNTGQALDYYKLYTTYRDSANNQETIKEMTRVEMSHLFERQQIADSIARSQKQMMLNLKHQQELANERADRNMAMGMGIGVLLLAGGLWSRLRYMRTAQSTIKRERDRSDELLLNILPAEIATELKRDGKAMAKYYDSATVLFTDFEQFTATAAKMPASDLVEEINSCFIQFDTICDKYKIEKIKTIGDAYMAAGGIPVPDINSTANIVKAALEMQQFINDRAIHRSEKGLPSFRMRAGIHMGPVVAGVVGLKKFQYDIWGDTVNTASRIESNGKVGKVNISQNVYDILKNETHFVFEPRGKIAAKGKGNIEMWFVEYSSQIN